MRTRLCLLLVIGSCLAIGWFFNDARAQDATDEATPVVDELEGVVAPGEPSEGAADATQGAVEQDDSDKSGELHDDSTQRPGTKNGGETTSPKPNVGDTTDASNRSITTLFNESLKEFNKLVETGLFFDITFGKIELTEYDRDGQVKVDPETGNPVTKTANVPFMVVFLAAGAVFFTFWHGFINIRGFKHAIDVVRGKFSDPSDPGDLPPFRALTSALSATVGLGNIASVAIAVKTGGPGAIFWMMFLGLFGMTAKFHESTLAQIFRRQNPDGTVSGGPMFYLEEGLKQINPAMGYVGKVLAIIFAVFCMLAALGGGNMFQANQAYEGFYNQFVRQSSLAEREYQDMIEKDQLWTLVTAEEAAAWLEKTGNMDNMTPNQAKNSIPQEDVIAMVTVKEVAAHLNPADVAADAATQQSQKRMVSFGFGLIMASLVAVVVIGGISRIGAATSRIVPTMCLLYVGACFIVILFNIKEIPSHIGLIFTDAFKWESMFGGFLGVLVIGFTRAAFSSEAGLGSSAIAHSAAQTSEPVREGFVASLEPFIDTIVICFMTAMVVLITDAYIAPHLQEEQNGAAVTLYAFQQTRLGAFFPYILSISIILFAFSTQISWCYYGERGYQYLFGLKTVVIFRLIFVSCVFVGAVADLGPVLGFSDLMLLSMAFPNIIGGVILAGLVRRKLKDYWSRYKQGDFKTAEKQVGADI